MISDIVLSIFAFYLFNQQRVNNRKWSLFFLFMGISAFIGGIYHGYEIIGEEFRFLSWTFLTVALIFAQLATYQYVKNNLIKIIFCSKSIILLFLAVQLADFSYLIIDTALSMIGFVVIGNLLFLKSLSNYITYGILISLTSVYFVTSKITLNPEYLTYNDIGHYITILSLFVISKGVKEDYQNSVVEVERM